MNKNIIIAILLILFCIVMWNYYEGADHYRGTPFDKETYQAGKKLYRNLSGSKEFKDPQTQYKVFVFVAQMLIKNPRLLHDKELAEMPPERATAAVFYCWSQWRYEEGNPVSPDEYIKILESDDIKEVWKEGLRYFLRGLLREPGSDETEPTLTAANWGLSEQGAQELREYLGPEEEGAAAPKPNDAPPEDSAKQ